MKLLLYRGVKICSTREVILMLINPLKVAIVRAGERGKLSADEGSYDSFITAMQYFLAKATRGEGNEKKWAFESRVVNSVEEALSWLAGRGAMVFVSGSMQFEAKRVAEKYPDIRVVILTGEIPKGEVVWFGKGWDSAQSMPKVLFKDWEAGT